MTPGLQLLMFLLGIYLGVELLGHSECEYSTLQDNDKLFSKVVVPIYNTFPPAMNVNSNFSTSMLTHVTVCIRAL